MNLREGLQKIKKGVMRCNRAICVYLMVALVLGFTFDCRYILNRAQLKALNRLVPEDYEYLVHSVEGKDDYDRDLLEEFRFYYEKVVAYAMPGADATSMLAFCYYYLGDEEKAISLYEEAHGMMRKFFSFPYNLGTIYFNRGDYDKAREYLKKAVMTSLSDNVQLITSSKNYFPFLGEGGQIEAGLHEREKTNYMNAYRMLVESCYFLKDYAGTIQHANEALVIALPHPEYFYYYLGMVTYELGRYEEAMVLFYEVVSRDRAYKDAMYYYGMSLKNAGQTAAGKKIVDATGLEGEHATKAPSNVRYPVRLF